MLGRFEPYHPSHLRLIQQFIFWNNLLTCHSKIRALFILPLSLIGKTPASDSGFLGSSPGGAAKSRSIMDGTIYQSLKKVGRRIRSVHRLKSGAMRTADLRCNNTLLRFAVNRNQNRLYKKFDFLKNL